MREQNVLKGSLCSLHLLYSLFPSLHKHYLWKAVGGEDVVMGGGGEKNEEEREKEKGGGVGTWWWFDQQIIFSLSFIRSRAERGNRLYRGINTV